MGRGAQLSCGAAKEFLAKVVWSAAARPARCVALRRTKHASLASEVTSLSSRHAHTKQGSQGLYASASGAGGGLLGRLGRSPS